MAGSAGEVKVSLSLDPSPEMRVLFAIAHARISASDIENLTTLLQQDLNWKSLLDAAVKHGLWPLLNRHLQQLPDESVFGWTCAKPLGKQRLTTKLLC